MSTTRALTLKEHPVGFPNADTDFELVDVPAPTEVPEGSMKMELVYVSVDPYMRGRMTKSTDSYISGFQKGKVIDGYAVGKIVESKNDKYPVGDYVSGFFPWQMSFIHKPNPALDNVIKAADAGKFPLSYYIGILGMPGMTAWLGLMKVCEPKAGETLFVTAANGAVGSLVVQLGKMKGLRVVACAGSDEKCKYIKDELKADVVFNYKTCGDYATKLAEVCPDGIDCYFDNVGGEMLDAVLLRMNKYGRIAICGAISEYNLKPNETPYRLKHHLRVLIKELRMQGFIVASLAQKYGVTEAVGDIIKGLLSNQIKYQIDEMKGDLSAAPHAFIRMLKGENHGKQVLKLE